MSIRKYIETAPLHDIARYDNKVNLEKEAVPFTGAPRKHPYDDEKLLLVMEPFSAHTVFYEFRLVDILHVEDHASIGTETGRNLPMKRIWVRNGSLGLQYRPFEVSRPLKYYEDSELLRQVFSGNS